MNPTLRWMAAALASVCIVQAQAQQPPASPAEVVSHRNLAYVEGGHERQVLDLHVPSAGGGPFPVIVWVHGGGWQNGSKDGCPPLRNGYVGRGYAVASLNYRLSGHAVFPAQIEDCKAAIRWLRAHAAQYRLDAGRIGVWGSSAGGHLVALLGTSGDVKEFDVGANLDRSSRVQAVCDYYGPSDFTTFVAESGFERHATADSPEAKLLGGMVKDVPEKARRASPVTYVTPDDPSFLIVHGDQDGTVPIQQSRLLFDELKKAGVSVHFHTIHGAGHGQGFGGPEIEPMVAAFFDGVLKATAPAAKAGAKTSESEASTMPPGRSQAQSPAAQPAAGAQRGRGIPFDLVLRRGDRNGDGRLARDEFFGPPALFDRLDRDRDGFLTREEHDAFAARAGAAAPLPNLGKAAAAPAAPTPVRAAAGPAEGGLLFFASYRHQDNPAAAANPHILGALFTIYWSDVETRQGVFDWSAIDRRIAPWTAAGKKVALRIMWSSSGNWPDPAAGHPTPRFVLDAGAVTVRSASSRTDVPLAWDPVYVRHAGRFLREVARKYDGDPNVLFIDVTPGAETNPYRFRRINAAEPDFKKTFAAAAASDGRKYSHELWLETVKRAADDAAAAFRKTPLLVTLNVGSLDGPEQFRTIGDHCVARGCYVGQNGLTGRSYGEESGRAAAFKEWGAKTKLYFEMLDASGGGTGSLLDVMKAAERIGCDYLGVYAEDVLRGTRGQPGFDPADEAALAYGARALGGSAAGPAPVPASAAPTSAATPAGGAQPRGIYVCRGPGATPEREVNLPFIDGWLVRPGWDSVEPGEGRFDWSHIENEIALAKRLGKKVTLAVLGGPQAPAWVYEAGSAGFDYTMPAGRRGEARIPVLWDETYLAKWTALVGALGRRFGNEPAVALVHVTGATGNGLEMQLPFMPRDLERWDKAGYSQEKAVAAWKRIVDAFAAAFPDKPLDIDVHPVLGSDEVAKAVAEHASRKLGARFGIFAGWLSGKPAEQDPHHAGMQALAAKYGPQGFAAFQMIASQTSNRSNPAFDHLFASGGLAAAFEQGFGWNARYFEIWETDATHPALHPLLTEWAARLRAPASTAPAAATPTAPAAAAQAGGGGFRLEGERWTCDAEGGPVSGILVKPEGKGPFPALLISHGLGGSAETFGLQKAREFVKMGFVCIAPDYTHNARAAAAMREGAGQGAGGRASARAGSGRRTDFGASAENLRRARLCIDRLRAMPEVDPKRIAAYGHSMGGFVTIGLAATSTNLLAAAAFTGSGIAPQDGYPAPSAEAAERIRTPFLMMHGSEDPVVRPAQSEALKEVLDRHGVPNERKVFAGEGHNIDRDRQAEVLESIRAWFARQGVLGF